jgi:Ca-activated chloride channel family protein
MYRATLAWAVVLGVLGLLLVAPPAAKGQGVLIVVDPDHAVKLPRIIYPPWPPHPPHPRPVPPPPPPPPPATYKVKEVEVQARLTDQVAQVQVSQTFENTGSRQIEAAFVFPLPYDGAVESMTLMVDGKEYPAKLLDAKEARKLYEDIVRKNKDPALLEWIGTGLFKTSVFPVPPGAKRTVSLRYAQLCRKQDGLTDFLFPLSTAKYTSHPVERVELRVAIDSQAGIKNVYSPTHAIEIKRPDDKQAIVTYISKNEVPSSDFRLLYDVGKGPVSTRVLSYRPEKDDDGFFLLLTSPEIKAPDAERPAKTVMFVIDRSGSMSGKKIEQARAAMKHVLNNLRSGDLFNIIAYDSQVEAFRPELQRYTEETRKAALGFVEGLYAGGSTNIDGALKAALGQLQDANRPNYVIFLTDGLPTAGETNEMKIAANAKEHNKARARIFAFGVGYDVNARLLERMVRDGFGQSEYVRPDENIEERVARFYNRIEAPVLSNVNIEFLMDAKPEEGKIISRVYPRGPFDLFAGEQLVVVGRYKKAGTAKVVVSGTVGSQQQKFDFPAELVERSKDETNAFIEKLWAVRRVGEILDELDLKGKNEELIKELVALATRHGILTPYTSFMADDTGRVHDMAANVRRAEGRLNALAQTEGFGGVAQRDLRGAYKRAAVPDRELFAPSTPAAGPGLLERFAGEAKAQGGGAGGGIHFADEAVREAQAAQQNLRNIGARTFFRRENGQWVDSQVTKEQEAQARRIRQFSDEYFELVRRHGRALAQYLAFDEPVLITIENQAYLIEP